MMQHSPYSHDAELAGDLANMYIYRMCEEHPGHDNESFTAAKLRLIGRYYSAAPTRGAGRGKDPKIKLYDAIAHHLSQSRIDAFLNDVKDIEIEKAGSIDLICDCHQYFQQIVVQTISDWRQMDASRRVTNRISFSSKYLHFHAPLAFPIYDSMVCDVLQTKRGSSYTNFCEDVRNYASHRHGQSWTPRGIDSELYTLAWNSGETEY